MVHTLLGVFASNLLHLHLAQLALHSNRLIAPFEEFPLRNVVVKGILLNS